MSCFCLLSVHEIGALPLDMCTYPPPQGQPGVTAVLTLLSGDRLYLDSPVSDIHLVRFLLSIGVSGGRVQVGDDN